MNQLNRQQIEIFLQKWLGSEGDERANKDSFFVDLCKALGVEPPPPKNTVSGNPYCFEKDIKIPHPSGKITTCFADFYKAGHFLIEAKQGGNTASKGMAKRGTARYLTEMEKAFIQVRSYSRHLETQPPFLLTCDIGSHFDLWMSFSGDYGGYGARHTISLEALRDKETFDLFVDIFTNPQQRNPNKVATKIMQKVAGNVAKFALLKFKNKLLKKESDNR